MNEKKCLTEEFSNEFSYEESQPEKQRFFPRTTCKMRQKDWKN